MGGLRLRDVTAQDGPAMTALTASLPEWFTPEEVETVREVIGPPGVVAVDGEGRIVGMCPWEARPEEWEICWLAVARERHRQGIGKLMLAWMVERARQAGVKRIRVQTVAHTSDYAPYAPTRAFYEACGFSLESVEPLGWPDGLDKAIYVLAL